MSTTTQVSISTVNPTSQTSTSDTWENRLQSAATFMGIPSKKVEEGLKQLGVEKEPAGMEMLSDESVTPFGDIRAIFCDNALFGSIPLAKVRMAMKYLRGPKESLKTDSIDPELMALKVKYGLRFKAEDVNPTELLEHYHPEQPNHIITTTLKKKFGDKNIIVFKPDSKVIDIEATSNYIADLEQGFPEQETVESDGMLVRLYAVGQVPNQMIEEDPLFEGSPLKRGRSIVNRVNWTDIGMPVRQFCRIIAQRDDFNVDDRLHVQELLRLAQEGTIALRKAYPDADLEYREMAQKNELPKLMLTMESANGKKQNPFNVGNNRKF